MLKDGEHDGEELKLDDEEEGRHICGLVPATIRSQFDVSCDMTF